MLAPLLLINIAWQNSVSVSYKNSISVNYKKSCVCGFTIRKDTLNAMDMFGMP